MGGRTRGQVLHSVLLAGGFGQGTGSPNSVSPVGTSEPWQLGAAEQREYGWTRVSARVGGKEGESCPTATCFRGEWECLAPKDFYACRVGEKALLCISFRELIKLPSMYFRWLWPTVSVWHSSMTAWGWFLVDLPPVCCPLSSRDGFVAAGGGGGGELDAGRSGELT